MSDYLRKYLYELKAESAKQALQDERREHDRKIEAEIQADKAALIKELDKGIDWVTPEPHFPAFPSEANSKYQSCNEETIPDDTAHKRLKDLKKFIALLQRVATTEGIEIDTMLLPINKKMLLEEIKKNKPKNGIWNIELSSFEQDWKLPFRKTICGVITNSKQIDPFFFNKIFNK